jgi:hypothetical protein
MVLMVVNSAVIPAIVACMAAVDTAGMAFGLRLSRLTVALGSIVVTDDNKQHNRSRYSRNTCVQASAATSRRKAAGHVGEVRWQFPI